MVCRSRDPHEDRCLYLSSRREDPPTTYGAYGYLVFTKRPTETERSRYMQVCNAYVRNLEPLVSFRNLKPRSMLVTFWLIRTGSKVNQRSPNCSRLVDDYGYSKAALIAEAVRKPGVNGPIMVAWSVPYQSRNTIESALVLDLSDFFGRRFGSGLWDLEGSHL